MINITQNKNTTNKSLNNPNIKFGLQYFMNKQIKIK